MTLSNISEMKQKEMVLKASQILIMDLYRQEDQRDHLSDCEVPERATWDHERHWEVGAALSPSVQLVNLRMKENILLFCFLEQRIYLTNCCEGCSSH